MNKKPVGRPLKKGAKKAGDLSPGECRFSFIADKGTVAKVRGVAKKRGITIKALMAEILTMYSPDNKTKNEQKLLRYLFKEEAPT